MAENSGVGDRYLRRYSAAVDVHAGNGFLRIHTFAAATANEHGRFGCSQSYVLPDLCRGALHAFEDPGFLRARGMAILPDFKRAGER